MIRIHHILISILTQKLHCRLTIIKCLRPRTPILRSKLIADTHTNIPPLGNITADILFAPVRLTTADPSPPMHNHYAGNWYPYQDVKGHAPGLIVDPKSAVVVGAAIEFMARQGMLPQFKFERRDNKLHVHFLDWHRRWSHSLTLAAAVGLVTGLLFGKWAGIVAGLGFAGHVLEDQLGFMGSNIFYPFTKERSTGLQLLRSGDAIPNFLTVWTSVALILFNLDRFSAQPRLNPSWFLGLAVVLPVAVLGGLYQWQRRRGRPEARESLQQRDIVSEMAEVEVA